MFETKQYIDFSTTCDSQLNPNYLKLSQSEIQQTYFSLAAYIIENDDSKIICIIYMLLNFPRTNGMGPIIHKNENRDKVKWWSSGLRRSFGKGTG